MVQREPIVTCDDEERRLVYTALESPLGAAAMKRTLEQRK
jgi:hypothetical protein